MRRRNFIKNLSRAGLAPFFLNGLNIHIGNAGNLQQLASMSDNDRVLVLIQLHGGNDGLNTLIPLNQYSQYYNLRSNIAILKNGARRYIKLDETLPDQNSIGLHPDMRSFKNIYDDGKAAVVQAVAYDQMNGSHFRSRDIWLMGGGHDANMNSGWAGRYLDSAFPNYPDAYPNENMPDPLALEIGSRVSLAFHREDGIHTGLNIEDPERFYDLVSNVGSSPFSVNDKGYYEDEINYIMGMEKKSNQYAKRINDVFNRGRNSSANLYPEKYNLSAPSGISKNKLSVQLKTIARLLSGGSRTKIFLARLDGFDTHANQVEEHDSSLGSHAALLYNLFSATEAFQKDLKALGLEDRVLTVTFSEFGRRAASNGSFGTDHGTAAPMFIFGKHVNPGIIGRNPNLSTLDDGNNVQHQHDYRQVFATVLEDWLGANPQDIRAAKFDDFSHPDKKLPIIKQQDNQVPSSPQPSNPESTENAYGQINCFPNPAKDYIMAKFKVKLKTQYQLVLRNQDGQALQTFTDIGGGDVFKSIRLDLQPFQRGNYICTLEFGDYRLAKHFIKL